MHVSDVFLGVDVGSTTVKVVVLDPASHLLAWRYVRSRGRPRSVLLETLRDIGRTVDISRIGAVGLSGSGGGPISDLVGGVHVNELVAQTRAVGEFHPEARTIIEIGGQDSKLLSVRWDEGSHQMLLEDFSMNALCAAGTGAFLDQQAERLGIAIDTEFARIALESQSPARIAGRCTVFAKSDMIHLQQIGTPMSDILMGVCLAMARNFTTVIGKGKRFTPPILFQGGVAFNGAVTRAFETVLNLAPGSIVVPEHHTIMAALGTAYVAMDEIATGRHTATFVGFDTLADVVQAAAPDRKSLPILVRPVDAEEGQPLLGVLPEGARVDAWLGLDVGSVSTNIVLIDEQNRVLARRYLPTAGRPLEAVRDGLQMVLDVADRVTVRGAGTTGSGRHLTGDFIGADVVRNEITAQARAAVAIDPEVDTVIEIGGQDSKFIRLLNGAVTDFTMNNACAAGTGSFLQEQADRLKIKVEREFSELAFASPCPAALGERCTVFMESDIVHHQQRGAKVPDLTAGLAYSIAENYLNRVVNSRPLGHHIFFQGGVAANSSVVAALREITRRPITVPRNHDVTGAIGVAILAREEMARQAARGECEITRFRGFDLADRHYESEVFECRACPNLCEVRKIVIEGEAPVFFGARCDKFEEAGRGVSTAWRTIPDLFAERQTALLDGWTDPGPRGEGSTSRLRVGMLRNLSFYDLFPFWRAFLDHLGCDVVLSAPTNPDIVRHTHERAVAESCFPVKLAFGHLVDVVRKDVDMLFLPSMMTRENAAEGQPHNHYCPLIPATPHLLMQNLPADMPVPRIVNKALHFHDATGRRTELRAIAAALTGASSRVADDATETGWRALQRFQETVRARGLEVLESLAEGLPGVVVVGRPYTSNDTGANLDLPYKLRRLGVLPMPMDYLPLDRVGVPGRYDDMFWRSGQDILRAAAMVRDDPHLQAIYLTNFNCGPDAFLLTYFRETLGGKPFLELEVDDHTADAGMITRCEAFFDSLNLGRAS